MPGHGANAGYLTEELAGRVRVAKLNVDENPITAAHFIDVRSIPTLLVLKSQAEKEISEQRKKIIDEAGSTVAETKRILRMLEEKKSQEVLAALERTSGKPDIVLARDPTLALAPIGVAVATYDVYPTLDAIQKAVKQADDYIEDDEAQRAHVPMRSWYERRRWPKWMRKLSMQNLTFRWRICA